jgi:hypothetical protein
MAPLMQAEAAHIWALYERGVARDVWARVDALGAVYVLESTIAEAAVLMELQPLVRAGLAAFDLIPVGPFTAMSNLFGTQARPIAPAPLAAVATRTQRVLALDTPERDSVIRNRIAPYLRAEAEHAWALAKAGVIRENYLRTDRLGAVIVLETAGVAEALALLSGLPLVREGLIGWECIGVGAFMGFDVLIDGELAA